MRSREDITFALTLTKAQHDAPGTASPAGDTSIQPGTTQKHSAAGASSALRSREDESSPGALTGRPSECESTGRDRRPSHGGRRLRGGTAPDGAHNPVVAGSTPAPAIHRHTSHPDPHERCCRPAFGSAAAFSGVPADREVCSGRADDSSALPTQTPFVPAYRLLASAPGFFARASSLLPAVARSLGRWFDAFVRAAGRRRRRSAVSANPSTRPRPPRPRRPPRISRCAGSAASATAGCRPPGHRPAGRRFVRASCQCEATCFLFLSRRAQRRGGAFSPTSARCRRLSVTRCQAWQHSRKMQAADRSPVDRWS
jgi:hypothetical protein